jgi:hypothetical protein
VNGDGFSDVIIGAPKSGAAYLYLGSAGGLPAAPSQTITGASGFGYSVAGVGDTNGDGYADVAISTFDAVTKQGTGALYLGGKGGLALSGTAMMMTSAAGVGMKVHHAWDFNGDGLDDVVVTDTSSSGLLLFLGVISGAPGAPLTLTTPQAETFFSQTVAGLGDVDGDGYDDVAGGTWFASYAAVFLGNLQSAAKVVELNGGANSGFGNSIASRVQPAPPRLPAVAHP